MGELWSNGPPTKWSTVLLFLVVVKRPDSRVVQACAPLRAIWAGITQLVRVPDCDSGRTGSSPVIRPKARNQIGASPASLYPVAMLSSTVIVKWNRSAMMYDPVSRLCATVVGSNWSYVYGSIASAE